MTKPKAKRMTPADQLERFRETAQEVGADESPGALDRAFGKLDPKKRAKAEKPKTAKLKLEINQAINSKPK